MRVTLKGVNRVTKRLADGSRAVYHYHRATNTRLPGKPGSPEFLSAYRDAENSGRALGASSETFAGLIKRFEVSPEFTSKAKSTQTEYVRLLKAAEVEFGTLPTKALNDPDVRRDFLDWRDKINGSSGAREADNRLSVISAMLTWAADRRLISANHLRGFKRIYKSDRADLIWLPQDIDAFMNVATPEMRFALSLALFTGQRQADLLAMTWAQYDGNAISLRQGKTGRRVVVPCTRELLALFSSQKRSAGTILRTPSGASWKKRHFAATWAATSAAAGIKDLHFHDLRGTAITLLARAGATVPEIAAITGHSLKTVTTILESYLSRTVELARSAIHKLDAHSRGDFANQLQTAAEEEPGATSK